MLNPTVALKTLLLFSLAVPTFASANEPSGLVLSGLSLFANGKLIPESKFAKSVTEEIVVTAPRRGRQATPIPPSLRRLFSERERSKTHKQELEWLAQFARQSAVPG